MSYLSIQNSPEANLHLIAHDNILVSKDLDKLVQNKKNLALKGWIAIAATVATLAVGVILGLVVAPYLGIVAAIAIIPLATWLYFKNKEKANQKILDSELKSLDTIYSQMIDCIKLRNDFRKNLFKIISPDLQKEFNGHILNKEREKARKLTIDEINNELPIYFEGKEGLSELDVEILQPTYLEEFLEEINTEFSKIESEPDKLNINAEDQKLMPTMKILKETIIKLEAIKGKVEVNISELKKDAQKVSQKLSNVKLKNIVRGKTLVELKEACQEFARPISTYFRYEEASENKN